MSNVRANAIENFGVGDNVQIDGFDEVSATYFDNCISYGTDQHDVVASHCRGMLIETSTARKRSRRMGQTLANLDRRDLRQAGIGSGRHAFVFAFPEGLSATADSVKVRRSVDGAGLQRAQCSINRRTAVGQ